MTMSPAPTTLGTHMKRRRNNELSLNQSAAARSAGVVRSTWVNWENDASVPEKFNHILIERVLRWAPGSVLAILAGGEPTALPEGSVDDALEADEPTTRRETSDESSGGLQEAAAPASAGAAADWPLALKIAIETGQLLDFDVQYKVVDGERLAVITMAKIGTYDTEEKRAAIRGQLELFGRIKDRIRNEAQASDDPPSDTDR